MEMSIIDIISSIGFPAFMSIYIVRVFMSILKNEHEHLEGLKTTLNELNNTIMSWNKTQEVQLREVYRIIEKLDDIIESNTKIIAKMGGI